MINILDIIKILIVYCIIIVIIGSIRFKIEVKKYILGSLSVIYNCFIGYIDTIVLGLIYIFLFNIPKGNAYFVPESEAGINAFLGFIIFIIYLIFLIPLNIFMKKKGKINTKIYIIINSISTLIGIIYFVFFVV